MKIKSIPKNRKKRIDNEIQKNFEDFMQGKVSAIKNTKPHILDFKNHLATIFTEVRLKQYLHFVHHLAHAIQPHEGWDQKIDLQHA